MDLSSILSKQRTLWCASCQSKKRTIEEISQILAEHISGPSAHEIFDALIERERLGSTGLGDGIGIPHCRLPSCEKPIGVLLMLETPIDFDSLDKQKVDIIFALVVPQEANDDHLDILATIAGKFSHADFRDSLRATQSDDELFYVITS
ncbi:PTS IIA-like nitrogen regulatory protein PtsN [Litoribrevibacter euphylliae]|uniref:PTS IIA-like nitrogen regulatory protein PtsN n=1 Tax=Litoribrevibacter euphylliae TaxID=1834034 RepID=A0ABV7HDZ7_9GAMM